MGAILFCKTACFVGGGRPMDAPTRLRQYRLVEIPCFVDILTKTSARYVAFGNEKCNLNTFATSVAKISLVPQGQISLGNTEFHFADRQNFTARRALCRLALSFCGQSRTPVPTWDIMGAILFYKIPCFVGGGRPLVAPTRLLYHFCRPMAKTSCCRATLHAA